MALESNGTETLEHASVIAFGSRVQVRLSWKLSQPNLAALMYQNVVRQ